MKISKIIKLVIAVFSLLDICKIQISTASQTTYAVTHTLPNMVEETIATENTISTPRNLNLPNCENLNILSDMQECSFNNLFIQLNHLKGQGSFAQVWKVTYSRSRIASKSAHPDHNDQHFAAIKFIQYSKLKAHLATKEIRILMKMYQNRVKHATKIIPDLTTNMSAINLMTNKTDSIKWIIIGMQCYSMDLDLYSTKYALISKFDIHLLVANLMVCVNISFCNFRYDHCTVRLFLVIYCIQ